MAAPQVQSLNQIMAELAPAFNPSAKLYNQQIAALPGAETAALGQLEAMKTNSFRDIARTANTRGVDFWGIPIEEQGRYLGEKYLPGVAGVKEATQKGRSALQLALAELERDKRLTGISTRKEQQSAYQRYVEAERDRQHRLQMMREQEANANRRSAASRTAQVNPAKEFLNYISGQFKSAGGQGNKRITRQQQDRWAEAFFAQNQVPLQARQGYWDLFNNTYNRASNYWEDPRYRR